MNSMSLGHLTYTDKASNEKLLAEVQTLDDNNKPNPNKFFYGKSLRLKSHGLMNLEALYNSYEFNVEQDWTKLDRN